MNNTKLCFDRKSGRYFARLQIENVRKRFWFGSNKRQAKDDLQQKLKDLAAGKIPFVKGETTAITTPAGFKDIDLRELAHKHLEWVKNNRSAATYELRKKYIQTFLKYVGPCMLSSVTRIKLEEYYGHAKSALGRSANGGNEHFSHVKTMFLWGEEMDLCDRPVRRFPKMRRYPPATTRVPVEDLRKFLFALPQDLRDMVLFGLLSGLRPQELRNLRRTHVRFHQNGTATVVIEHHKTSASAREPVPRSVPLCPAALEIVQRQLEAHPDSEYIFVNAAATPYSKDVLRRRLRRHSKAVGVKTITPYSLRHTFASMQAEAGINQISLSQLMGHTSPRTTARYVHNSDEHYLAVMTKHAGQVAGLLSWNATEKTA